MMFHFQLDTSCLIINQYNRNTLYITHTHFAMSHKEVDYHDFLGKVLEWFPMLFLWS